MPGVAPGAPSGPLAPGAASLEPPAGLPAGGFGRQAAPARLSRKHSRRTVGAAVAQFALSGLLAVLLVGIGGVAILRDVGRSEATRDARALTALAAHGIAGPAITPALLRGERAAIARMDRALRPAVLRDPVVRVKIWSPAGEILYSDEHRLIGSTYPLGPDEHRALASGTPDAELSDLARPENRFERRYRKLLEVYLGIRGPGRRRLLFETYQRYGTVASSGRRLWLAFLPVLVGALLLVAVLQVPLAWSLARRVRRGEQERLRLLERALDAQEQERLRIATDLHDGVVQSLVGISYRLAAATGSGEADEVVGEAAAETRRSIRELRSLLVDIYPPSLQREGLAAALSDLMTRASSQGMETELHVAPDAGLDPRVEALVFRAAQEALRNAIAHAGAGKVTVAVERENGRVRLSVRDDGRGFEPATTGRTRSGPHFGLRALEDLVRDAGGTMRVDSAPGRGTTVRVEVLAS